ncbi:serine protease snake-like [Musca domestica]|uniref:Serine protease snake-like n=1 Tax=Musca domestica TaxID=7370 RepID=A0ABM3VAI9_MUSDO|nr:serine protease snake-like [Musca domestica]
MVMIKMYLLLVLYFQCVPSSATKFPTKCWLSRRTVGTCIKLLDCPAAITGKSFRSCYTVRGELYVCCKKILWGDMRPRRITGDCGMPRYEIYNGLQTEYREFPYMAALGWDSTFKAGTYDYKCGGVLIMNSYIVTAAHCAVLNGLPPSVVLVGGTNLNDSRNKPIKVTQVIRHPLYKSRNLYHDIALLKLEKCPVANPLCIWTLYALDSVNITAVGYGHTFFAGAHSERLLKTHLSVIPNRICVRHYRGDTSLPKGIADTQLCAKDFVRQSDTCQGDSGGPLILRSTSPQGDEIDFLVGITSYGGGCGFGKPAVYTRVSQYIDWIESIIF